MTKVEEVAQSALSAVSCAAGRVLTATWVNDRYRQLIGKVRFKHTRKIGELAIPAVITAGTVTTVRGSKYVVGNAAAQAAWSTAQIGWHFRGGVTWYRVVGVSPVNKTLELASPFAEDALTAAGYALAQRYLDLPTSVRSLDLFVHMRRRTSFHCVPLEFLDALAPSRNNISTGPGYVTELGQGENGGKSVEVYPMSATSEVLHYVYRELPERLNLTDTLPSVIDGYVLKEGVLVDVMRWLQAQAANGGKPDIAALWRNDSRAQETKWDKAINAAIMADRGVDDYTFVLESARFLGENRQSFDIVTAQDQVWGG